MSKRFVDFDEFKKELKDLRSAISDLGGELDGLSSHVDTTVDVVNANADNGEKLEKRLNELQDYVKRIDRRAQTLSLAVDQKNDTSGPALAVGLLAAIVFVFVFAEIGRLNDRIDILMGKVKKADKVQPVGKTTAEATFCDKEGDKDDLAKS